MYLRGFLSFGAGKRGYPTGTPCFVREVTSTNKGVASRRRRILPSATSRKVPSLAAWTSTCIAHSIAYASSFLQGEIIPVDA